MKINWKQDYNNEFYCIRCNVPGMIFDNIKSDSKFHFKCKKCGKETSESCNLKPKYFEGRFKAAGLGCPSESCNSKHVKYLGKNRRGKKTFQCTVCNAISVDSYDLTKYALNRFAQKELPMKKFTFEDDKWDLRSINHKYKSRGKGYISNFENFKCAWFKTYAKQYVYHLCKLGKPFPTIENYLTGLRDFSRYLATHKIANINEINRETVIDFISTLKTGKAGITVRLRTLRQLFITGNTHAWFNISPDLVKISDYPKINKNNPDPIPDIVREQIEKNLHKLPDPIARMWIICFFSAMRPYELAFLKKNCLEQVGDKWKLIWWRKKGKRHHQHSVPITRTIARVVQEQAEYIENLWGKDWEYLFCHYQNISRSDINHPKLKEVKKMIPGSASPLQKVITTLIKVKNIKDDNGELAKFTPRLIRETRLTELFLKGHDLSVVSAWAGHRQLATTANFYTQVTCEQIEKEVGHIQSALVNADGKKIYYESMPKSFWDNPVAHELEVVGTHVNTPIYGYCGLDLDEECDKFRACYTCRFFVAKPEKLSQYVSLRDELRDKQERALGNGHGVLVEQFARQADQLDKIIASLQEAA